MLNNQKTKDLRPKTGNFETSHVKNTQSLLKSVPGSQGRESRRQTVLNALFMEYITDLMASGEVSREVTGKSIHILGVKVSQDFSILNVKWVGGDPSQDETIQQILNRCAGHLRSELIGLNILGNVPRIQFVRDRAYSTLSDVDQALRTADYGHDYVPLYRHLLEPVNIMPNYASKEFEVTSSSPLPDSTAQDDQLAETVTKEKNIFLSDFKEKVDDIHESVVESEAAPTKNPSKSWAPRTMKMDVLGLKHDVLMSKVQESLKRSKAHHRSDDNLRDDLTFSAEAQRQKSFPSVDTERFTKFLADRKKKRLAFTKTTFQDAEAVNYMLGRADEDEDSAYASFASGDDDNYFDDDQMMCEDGNVGNLDDDARDK